MDHTSKPTKRLLVAPTDKVTKQVRIPNGITLRVGPSHLDGAEIATIAVFGSVVGTSVPNKKTGAMVQVYYLRTDINPQDTVRQGLDQSICGDCPLSWAQAPKGEARCYVLPFHAPSRVFEQWETGKYPQLDEMKPQQRQAVMIIFNTVPIRLGAYADPACDQETLQISLSRLFVFTELKNLMVPRIWEQSLPVIPSAACAFVSTLGIHQLRAWRPSYHSSGNHCDVLARVQRTSNGQPSLGQERLDGCY